MYANRRLLNLHGLNTSPSVSRHLKGFLKWPARKLSLWFSHESLSFLYAKCLFTNRTLVPFLKVVSRKHEEPPDTSPQLEVFFQLCHVPETTPVSGSLCERPHVQNVYMIQSNITARGFSAICQTRKPARLQQRCVITTFIRFSAQYYIGSGSLQLSI